ncbi:ABC transporter permease [Knoellia sinensis KCTC 19936]|uniref:ABC transporter permease n=1 Tax=Knoellia sinensis KCTC 19936 TaxID=1385520 RepID=A0A0A0JDK2_9MICO|nr:ABC transporter permease [Knoellia sinensis]KGN34092.1 ABC transporter permease [Knoellia sinensis KCTC 19936]
MTATTLTPTERPASSAAAQRRPTHSAIPTGRLLKVELRKMFNTRSGMWLMCSIGILAILATAAVLVFAPEADLTYDNFGAAVGMPMVIILPIIAALSVTSEWSQRSGLTTFTLVPHRGRVITAKLVVAIAVGVAAMVVALAVGALGNLLGAAIAGIDPVWDLAFGQALTITLATVLNMLIGFMLGVLIRNSPGAMVAYFVYNFALAPLAMLLASSQKWFRDLQPWVDFNFAQGALFEGGLTGTQWAQLGVTGLFWLAIPLAIGLLLVRRSEVK